MDREAWRAAVHGITKSQIQLSNRSESGKGKNAETKEESRNNSAALGQHLGSFPRNVCNSISELICLN